MSYYYTYGFLAGMSSAYGCILGNITIGILLTICFGIAGWIYDIKCEGDEE